MNGLKDTYLVTEHEIYDYNNLTMRGLFVLISCVFVTNIMFISRPSLSTFSKPTASVDTPFDRGTWGVAYCQLTASPRHVTNNETSGQFPYIHVFITYLIYDPKFLKCTAFEET